MKNLAIIFDDFQGKKCVVNFAHVICVIAAEKDGNSLILLTDRRCVEVIGTTDQIALVFKSL